MKGVVAAKRVLARQGSSKAKERTRKGKSKKGAKDLGAQQHAKMLRQRDAEADFMRKLEQKERAFKQKQLVGARGRTC